jgi:hypothetical protein
MDYLSLGDSVAFLGIIIAVYGVLRPRWRLNFVFSPHFLFSVAALIILGLLSSFAAFIFKAYTRYDAWATGLQGATFVFFVLAAIDFIRCVFRRRPLYDRKRSEKAKIRFTRGVLDYTLFASDEETLNAVISIVRNSLDELCCDIHSMAYRSDSEANDNVAAYLLNTLLGESKVANLIAEKRLDFIEELVSSLKKNKISSIDVGDGIESLLTALYINPKSYLYQQLGYDGLTNYASIYKVIFEDEYFVREHQPISTWYDVGQIVNYRNQVRSNPSYVQVFLKGFTVALKRFAYENPALTEELGRGMYRLSDYIESVGREAAKLQEFDYFAPSYQAFQEVLRFVSHDFYYDVFEKKAKAGQVTGDELTPPLDTQKYQECLSAAFCQLFFDAAEAIVSLGDRDDSERMLVLELNEIYLQSIGQYAYVEGLRESILHKLWAKSAENINRGHFPAVFRALAVMLYWKHANSPTWAKVERNKLIDTLRNELKPRILKDELMANRKTKKEKALLPTCIIFDRVTKKFYSVDANDNKDELKKS